MSDEHSTVSPDTARNVRATVLVFTTTLVIFVLFCSADMVSMSYDLPDGDLSEAVISLAETWHQAMERAGLAGVSQWVRDTVGELRRLPWG